MASSSRIFGRHRAFNWRYSFATAFTVALHTVAFLMILAPVMAPRATERVVKSDVQVTVITADPERPKPPPPAPQPPQKPQTRVAHTIAQPPISPPPIVPVVVAESSPRAEVAPPPRPPTPQQADADVRPSALVRYRHKFPPKYPAQAIRQRQEGTVTLKVLVGVGGDPLQIQVMGSSGYRSLDQAAIAAARQWKFNPATRNGVPRQGWVIIPIEFSLDRF